MKKLVLLSTLIVTMFTAQARKFYVSNTGNNLNTTTQAQNQATPWATLSKVQSSLSTFIAGDSILFKRGDKFIGTLFIQNKSNLYFGEYGLGELPLFWGNGASVSPLIYVVGCTNITFSSIKISDTTISTTDRTVPSKITIAFQLTSNTTGTVIKKCVMDRIGYGIYITTASSGNTIDSCDIGNLRMIRNTPTSVNPDDDYGGVPIQISSSNNKFTNNYLHDCWSVSYDYGRDGGGVEFFEEGVAVENNIIAYNTFYDCNGTFEHGSNSDGIANNPIRNNKIYYNKIINNNSVVYINNNGQYRTKVSNLQFYNNVILQTLPNNNPVGSSGIMFSMATSDTSTGIIVLKNNIFQLSGGLPMTRAGQFTGTNLTHTNNIYKLSNGSVTNFTLTSTEIATQSSIWVSTVSTNPLGWDYNLIDGSRAINAGTDVGLIADISGNPLYQAPDMGILEKYTVVSLPCSFIYGQWSTCVNGSQTRSYTFAPRGCVGVPNPDSLFRACSINTIRRFYYDPTRIAIYIESSIPGQLLITNTIGSVVRNVTYRANGQWIGVRNFARGVCFASTQGQSITFLR